jgi:hypothetical protein
MQPPSLSFSNINADRIVSVSAIVVSLGTLFLIMYQTNLIREEQKASVMPSLGVGYGIHIEGNEFEEYIRIRNRGLGPAFIREVRIIDNEEVFETDPVGYLLGQELHDRKEAITINRLLPGVIIPANESLELYRKQLDSTSQVSLRETFSFPEIFLDELFELPDHRTVQPGAQATIEIIYENIYGDRWVARSDQHAPQTMD